MNKQVVYSGKKQLHMANAMYNLGKMYAGAREALWQSVENARDAMNDNDLKPTIWVAIYDDKIVITDNGCGMLPVMPKSDQAILADYFAKNDKTIPDIRSKLSNAARHSLVWLSDYVSYSPKDQQSGENLSGVRGIGALAYMTFAKNARVTSKPARWLVEELTKRGTQMPRGQSFSLEMPQINVYQDWIMESIIVANNEPLVDPFGNELPHGSQVVISNFNDTTITTSKTGNLTAGRVLGYLRQRINPDAVTVWVGDHTKFVRSSKIWVKVTKEEIKGTLVYSGSTTSADGAVFSVSLFYDPVKDTNSPTVTRKNTAVFPLTQIEELDHFPWNKLGGEIQFPQYVVDAQLWNSQKDMLVASEPKKLWVNALIKLEPVIKDKLKNALRIHTEKSNQEFIDDFVGATREALSLVEYFAWHRNPGVVKNNEKESDQVEVSARSVRAGIRARVLNENGHGVFDIPVELLNSNRERIALQTTGLTGRADFGKTFKSGTYIVRVVPPNPTLIRGAREFMFTLNHNTPGYGAVFKLSVEVGHEVRPRLRAKMLEPEWVTLPTNIAYQVDVERGALLINMAHSALNKALMDADELMQLVLLSRYTSDAHALLLEVEEPELLMQIAGELNAKLFPLFAEKRAARKSEIKGARMKKNRRTL